MKLLRLHQNQNDKFQTPSNNPYAFAPTLTTPKSIDTPLEIMFITQPENRTADTWPVITSMTDKAEDLVLLQAPLRHAWNKLLITDK